MSNQVAKIILQQLGGNKFLAMTGAKDVCFDTNCLIFKLPKNAGKVFAYKIELDAGSDTYRLHTIRKAGRFEFATSTLEGVYCDMLQELIAKETGFALAL